MAKTIFVEMGGTYVRQGDYFIPCGKLNSYLADIDEQAEEMFFRLVEQMAEREGVTEQFKAANGLEWTRRMNNIRACAMELVNKEIIYN